MLHKRIFISRIIIKLNVNLANLKLKDLLIIFAIMIVKKDIKMLINLKIISIKIMKMKKILNIQKIFKN